MENQGGYEAPYLKDICLEVLYRDQISKATPATAEYVRNGVDDWERITRGRGEIDFRYQCIERLNDSLFTDVLENGTYERIPLDVCAVLDCLLDDDFTALELNLPSQTIKVFSSLLAIISHRSPKLKELVIKFNEVGLRLEAAFTDGPPTKKMKLEPDSNSSNSLLPSLSSMSLLYTEPGSSGVPLLYADETGNQSILSIVGKSCPALSKLLVSNFRFRKQDALGLILGDFADVLFTFENKKWVEDSVLETLWIPREFQSLLCSSLEKLEIYCFCPDANWRDSFSNTAYAFTLRHLRNLKSVSFHESTREFQEDKITTYVLEALKKEKVESQQKEFEEICLAAAARSEMKLIGSHLSYASGSLALTSFAEIPIDDIEMMRDVGILFRNLKKVGFLGNYKHRVNSNYHSQTSEHNHCHDTEIDSILKSWSNVESITIGFAECGSCMKLVLNALGPALKSLHFEHYSNVDLAHLIPCTNLESLTIGNEWDDCTVISDGAVEIDSLIALPFLPALKKFVSYACLGEWSPLFESKPKLTELRLNSCCHIGQGDNPSLVWDQVADIWKSLETLELRACSGLSLTMLAQHFSQLKNLQSVVLPISVTENETREVINGICQSFMEKKVQISFSSNLRGECELFDYE